VTPARKEFNMDINDMISVVKDTRDVLERIARAQEGMLAIAAEARQERLKLSAALQDKLKQPFVGK